MIDPATEKMRAAFAKLSDRAEPGAECPAAETLWVASMGELPAAERRRIGLHVIDCPACAEAWRLARDIEMDAGLAAAERIRAPAIPSFTWWAPRNLWALAAAASLLLAVPTILKVLSPGGAQEGSGFRAPYEEPIRSLLPAGAPLPRKSCHLAWSGPAGARYDIRVATEDLSLLANATGLTDPSFTVPEEALAGVGLRARIVWQVTAVMPDGSRLKSRSFVSLLE